MKYTICSTLALATHAAIGGGLDPARAYALRDLYLKKLDTCNKQDKAKTLFLEIERTFATQVQAAQAARSSVSCVEKCKLFIDQHLGKPFTLDDIAKALHINKSYLSRRFLQESGMRIMEYTRKKRIEAAAHMLKHSDKAISTIAATFCFPTQSHFGKWFKQLKGSTPLKYRSANQVLHITAREQSERA